MSKPESECTRRYQPRLNLDERIGEVFDSLMALPEDARKAEIVFLMQLGYLIKKALGHSLATAVAAALLAAVGASSGHFYDARGEAPRRARSRISRRYQPRLNLDVRMGEVFQDLIALPEEARKTEITFLMQLGYWTKKALGNGLPGAIASVPFALDGLATEGPAVRGADSPSAKPKLSGLTEDESAGAAMASLQGWCVDDDAFESAEPSLA